MQKMIRAAGAALVLCGIACIPALVRAQAAQPAKPAVGQPVAPGPALDSILSIVEKQFVSAADAMPEDKFGFVPTTGEFKTVRSFGDQLKHVIEANAFFFADPGATQDEIKARQAAAEKLKTKAEIMQALKDSFAQAHAYVSSISAENASLALANGRTRTSMAAFGMAHMMDHYGQLVVFLRLNGIVPPASRK